MLTNPYKEVYLREDGGITVPDRNRMLALCLLWRVPIREC